jgi:hypothetical protein
MFASASLEALSSMDQLAPKGLKQQKDIVI